jgi:hypothetical protein
MLRDFAGKYRRFAMAILSNRKPWHGPTELPRQTDLLIISHLVNPSHAGGKDFYFAHLPEEISQQGYSVVIALINHTGARGAALAQRWKKQTVPRVVLSKSLGIAHELTLNTMLKTEAGRLRDIASKESHSLTRDVALHAAEEALSGGARAALLLGSQITNLVSDLKPRAMILTYEGHAWERVAFAAARRETPTIRCIGYQHAALFRLQHAIRRNLGGQYDPDYILTSGLIGQRMLGTSPGLLRTPVSVLGSNRGFTDKTGPSATAVLTRSDKKRKRCLVLPEGIPSECHLLFEFSLHCARLCPEIEFVWRLHPVVRFESLVAANCRLKERPTNVELSVGVIESDLPSCSWALYRGTTAIVQAVGAGLQPVYLRVPGEMTIDPLYELKGWKVSVETVEEFQKATSTLGEIQRDDQHLGQESARAYCQNMFAPFDVDVLLNLIGNPQS